MKSPSVKFTALNPVVLPALLACLLSAAPEVRAEGWSEEDRYVEGSAEELFWQEPATLHNFKKRGDLHNVLGTVLVLTELEFTRLGDLVFSLGAQKPVRPLERGVDSIGAAYDRIPQVLPVRRTGELVDAFQIPEFSLSDTRALLFFTTGSGSGLVGPIMQVRFYKIFVWVEDIVDDLDRAVMFPVNYGVSRMRNEETNLRSIGYAGDAVSVVRRGLFWGIRTINRGLVRLGSNAVLKIEGGFDAAARAGKMRRNGGLPIYARMPYRVYAEHSRRLEKTGPSLAGTAGGWNSSFEAGITIEEMLRSPEEIRIEAPEKDGAVLFVTTARAWKKAPEELRRYVITGEEFRQFLRPA